MKKELIFSILIILSIFLVISIVDSKSILTSRSVEDLNDSDQESVVSANDDSEDLGDSENDLETELENEEDEVLISDEVEILEEGEELSEVEEETTELEEIEESDEIKEIERRAIFALTRVTIGEGFVVKNDDSDAAFFRGMWIVKKFINKTANLEEIENAEIEIKKSGFIVLGLAEEKEKFRIEITESDNNESITFNIKDNTGAVVGDMKIKPKKYNRLTLWFGNLTLNSGKYIGTWKISAVAKTKIIKPEVKKPAAWRIFAFKQRKEAVIKEKIQERVFENEGLGTFIKEKRLENFGKINKSERKVEINKKEKLEEKLKEKLRKRNVANRLESANK